MTLRGFHRRKSTWPPHVTPPDAPTGTYEDTTSRTGIGYHPPVNGECIQCSTCSGACGQLSLELTRLMQAATTQRQGKEFP